MRGRREGAYSDKLGRAEEVGHGDEHVHDPERLIDLWGRAECDEAVSFFDSRSSLHAH